PDGTDLFRRGVELRGRTARLRLSGDTGTNRLCDDPAQGMVRFQSLLYRFQPALLFRPDADLSLLPDTADGADPDACARRPEEGMARSVLDPRRNQCTILAYGGLPDPVAKPARHDASTVRECLRRDCNGLRVNRPFAQLPTDPAVCP